MILPQWPSGKWLCSCSCSNPRPAIFKWIVSCHCFNIYKSTIEFFAFCWVRCPRKQPANLPVCFPRFYSC